MRDPQDKKVIFVFIPAMGWILIVQDVNTIAFIAIPGRNICINIVSGTLTNLLFLMCKEMNNKFETENNEIQRNLNRDYHRNIKTLNVGRNSAGFEFKHIDIITYSS